MLEPLHQAGQWAWQQAASRVNTVGSIPGLGQAAVPLNWPQELWPEFPGEQTHSKGLKPTSPQMAFGQRVWNRGRQKLQQLAEQVAQKIRGHQPPVKLHPSPVKPHPSPVKSHPPSRTAASGFRPRQQILRDFPYNEVGKLPRFTLTPDDIRVNPAAERLHQLEATQVLNAPWDSEHLFNPFLEH
ncbi:hypothetical protein [Vampirovibrio chlorellavorus]|uniref:hypothetical protein n=1 Tax=Vampirovibrio chlorellavorus TaxID=758823 RepID=UPI0026EE7E67|nr:hypothetical protein [Vampirovibrio chlorellavorus]